jgi:hypothetical protein
MIKASIFVFSLFLLLSCATSPVPPENKEFERETGVNLTFAKRGLSTIPKGYNDTGFDGFYSKLINNQIIFSIDANQNEFAVFMDEGENILVKIKPILSRYNPGSRNALLTATIYAIGLLKTANISQEVIEERFYEVISDYAKYGIDVSSIVNDDLFKEHKFRVINNGIGI